MRKIIALIIFVHFFLLAFPFNYFLIKNDYTDGRTGGDSGVVLVPIFFSIIVSLTFVIIIYILKKIFKNEHFIFNILISILTYINCIFIYFWNSVYVYQLYDCDVCYGFAGRFFTTLYFVLELVLTFFVLRRYLELDKRIMKKAAILGGLMFFVHGFLFQCFFWGQDKYISENNGDSDHGIDMFIAIFYAILFFLGIIITIVLEKYKKRKYKYMIFFLVFGNCLLQFYWQSFHQYDLFSSPERFSNFSIILILGYFLFELGFTYYIVDRLYNKSQNT